MTQDTTRILQASRSNISQREASRGGTRPNKFPQRCHRALPPLSQKNFMRLHNSSPPYSLHLFLREKLVEEAPGLANFPNGVMGLCLLSRKRILCVCTFLVLPIHCTSFSSTPYTFLGRGLSPCFGLSDRYNKCTAPTSSERSRKQHVVPPPPTQEGEGFASSLSSDPVSEVPNAAWWRDG